MVSRYLDSFVKDQITKSVHESSQGLYSLKIDKLDAQFWSGAIDAEGLLLHQDTAVLKRLKEQSPRENFSNIHVSVKSVKIHHIRWLNYIFNNDLKVGKIVLQSPEMIVAGNSPSESVRSFNKNFIDLLPGIIAGFAGSLKIEEFIVESGNLSYDIKVEKGIISQKADKIFIDLKDILIDTIPAKKVLYSEDIKFNLSNYHLKTPDQAYSIKIGGISGSLSDSTLKLNELEFIQRDLLDPARILTHVNLESIQGSGVGFRNFFYGKDMMMNEIIIESPRIESITEISDEKSADGKGNKKTDNKILIPPFISRVIQSFNINTISVRNGNLKNKIIFNQNSIAQSADKIFIDVLKVAGRTVDTINLAIPKGITVSFKNYTLAAGSERFHLRISNGHLSSQKSEVILKNVSMVQDHPPGMEANHYTCLIKEVLFQGLDLKKALYETEFIGEVIHVNDINFKFLLHEGKAIRPEYVQIMPNEIVKKLKLKFNIRQVNLNAAAISYSDDTGNKPILFTFEKLKARIVNLTNDPKLMSQKTPAVLTAETLILGKGKLNLRIEVPLLSDNFMCSYKGTFDGMDINGFNSVLAFAGVKTESGRIEPSTFDVKVSGGHAEGNMKLIYQDLKIKVLDKEGKTNKIKSLFGNFIIKNSNPKEKDEEPEIISIKGTRKPEDSFFSFLWRPIQEGIIKLVTKDSVYPG
ncbi:MAG: DUF748 domain-containing protein [Cytophagaceae bacterium]|nr:DUF748 domain-containing protein [Cytophagaceae bacterium]